MNTQFLGTTIDSTLSWDEHCKNVANKISRSNGMINRVKHLLPPSSLKLLYHSFIQSHLEYALPIWGGCSNQNRRQIVTIQKRAIRTITKSFITAHTEPRMKKLSLLKFDDLYQLQSNLLVHDCFYNKAPINVRNCMQRSRDTRHSLRNQSQPLDLRVPNHKTRAGSNSFTVKGPILWNKIPHELRSDNQKQRFKKTIKNSILQNYAMLTSCNNPTCQDRNNHTHNDHVSEIAS